MLIWVDKTEEENNRRVIVPGDSEMSVPLRHTCVIAAQRRIRLGIRAAGAAITGRQFGGRGAGDGN